MCSCTAGHAAVAFEAASRREIHSRLADAVRDARTSGAGPSPALRMVAALRLVRAQRRRARLPTLQGPRSYLPAFRLPAFLAQLPIPRFGNHPTSSLEQDRGAGDWKTRPEPARGSQAPDDKLSRRARYRPLCSRRRRLARTDRYSSPTTVRAALVAAAEERDERRAEAGSGVRRSRTSGSSTPSARRKNSSALRRLRRLSTETDVPPRPPDSRITNSALSRLSPIRRATNRRG